MAKDKYEISIWEDYIVPAVGDIPSHYKERKLMVIGSSTMESACRAFAPSLVESINGTNIFTFKLYCLCPDNGGYDLIPLENGMYRNPFIPYLVNERKVKVKWKDKWYDFVIKNIDEVSDDKTITYTCKDLFINELSKTGFNLEFDTELENNYGTAAELAAKILEDTDWQLDEANSDIIQQFREEAVYETTTTAAFTAINLNTGLEEEIPTGKLILVFYSCVNESDAIRPIYFLYDPAQLYPRDYNNQLVVNVDTYMVEVQATGGVMS